MGWGIVIGSGVMKLPQLYIIYKRKSARGISTSGSAFETLAYAVNLTYAYRNGIPFSTYGENAFLTAQNAILMLLLIQYAPRPRALTSPTDSRTTKLLGTLLIMLVGFLLLLFVPPPILATFQALTLPISIASKVPQITENHRNKSTGNLSWFAVLLQTAGCGARIYTIYREVDDVLVALGALLAFVLNAIIGVQMWLYWGRDPIVHKVKVEDKQESLLSRNEKAFVERTPPHSRSGTPSLSRPGTPLSASRSGRNWSRKSVYDVV
ncbi:mannose-P-dolichol utilization defect 1 protein [Schizophyllum commune Loenen D]|nr:mannose-P-dolichol utilization defect 1 protein [Schizophyllum commune Loenen D]